ncbi:MAG: CopG family transcriptional regulator [Pseudomonadota bacterium]
MNVQSEQKPATVRSLDGTKTITVEEFDKLFDDGSDEIDDFIDWSKGKMVPPKARRVNVDFPPLMVRDLDAVATARGVTRQALIKMWLADKLDEHRRATAAE